MQQIIDSGRIELLPDSQEFHDWDTFLRAVLAQSAQQLAERQGVKTIANLRWSDVSKVEVRHPLSSESPFLGFLLDMPHEPLAGCVHCVRLSHGRHGATERMVVSPGHEREGIPHMPGGQSGQPFSPHYSDQQQAWVEGRPLPFSVSRSLHRLILRPKT